MFGKWPHEFFELTLYQQNLAVLCAADRDAAILEKATRLKAFPGLDISEVA
jgi:hypothetical protein